MANECGKCKIKVNQNVVKCTGMCKQYFHPNCVDITCDEAKMMSKNKNIKWFCDNCILYLKNNDQIKLELDALKSNINKNFEDIRNMFSSNNDAGKVFSNSEKKKSYSEAVGEVVVIKPKKVQESKTTKEVLRKALNPTKLEVGITQIKDTKEGGVLIKCKSREEVEKIKVEAEKKLKKTYDIKTPEHKNPHIKILDLDDDIDKDVLEDSILKQNAFLDKEKCFFKVKVVKKMKSKFMAIVECDPLSSEVILRKEKISIGWSICRVYEYVPVFRCYRCGEYDHKANTCKKVEKCLKCASSDHKTADCVCENYNCVNCMLANDRFKLNLDIKHTVFDINCPVYTRKVESLKQKIKITQNK